MLFDATTLAGIVDGSISLTFRRWATPRVTPGASQLTKIGRIAFTSVDRLAPSRITGQDLRASGFSSREALLKRVAGRDRDRLPLYRIGVALIGDDPRVALRASSALDAEELAGLSAKLTRMDRAAEQPWTREVLELIGDRPAVMSTELAADRGEERYFFKNRVRRLKTLGLTESLDVGYRLSPRGRAYLDLTR